MTRTPKVSLRVDERPGGNVAYVSIGNLHRLNAVGSAEMEELSETLGRLAEDDALRALVLTGQGDKAFIGGADINEMAGLRTDHEGRRFISKVHRCCDALRAVPAPTIARINGYAFGAGLEIAAACDLRVASATALFGMPEVRLGVPSVVEAALLPMLVGWGRARRLLLLGETIGADEALDWGLVERVVASDDLDGAVETWIGHLMEGMPEAIRLQKKLMRDWEDLPVRAAIQAGIDSFARAVAGGEPATAMAAFLERRRQRKLVS